MTYRRDVRGMGASRRGFLAAGAAASIAAWCGKLRAWNGQPSSALAADPMRPQFHLLPAHNWMNDPNGPIYFGGRYHMFFQYNPQAAVWGNMSWNHASSPDMIHWTHEPLAMTPTPGSADAYGCFSGSAIALGKRVYFVYTGVVKNSGPAKTIKAEDIQESQCLAWSDDADLIHWTKCSQPILPLPPAGLDVTGFRDPSVWKQGEWYYMTVGSGIAKVGGCVLLYRSKDLKQWDYLHPLTQGEWNGKWTPNPCDDGEMWECPDFFALDGGHVLIYSTLGKVVWQSGKLDETTMRFHPAKTGLLDLDAFYAPKTQLDAKGRRILWGWVQERRPEAAMKQAGWSGMMSLPRVLSLDSDGTLRMAFLPELRTLRGGGAKQLGVFNGAAWTLPRATGEASYNPGAGSGDFEFGLRSEHSGADLCTVRYVKAKHAFSVDGKEVALESGDVPTVHAYVDGSVIELILGGRIGVTKRFYYEAANAPNVLVSGSEAKATALEAWTINPISNDRLTTPARSA